MPSTKRQLVNPEMLTKWGYTPHFRGDNCLQSLSYSITWNPSVSPDIDDLIFYESLVLQAFSYIDALDQWQAFRPCTRTERKTRRTQMKELRKLFREVDARVRAKQHAIMAYVQSAQAEVDKQGRDKKWEQLSQLTAENLKHQADTP